MLLVNFNFLSQLLLTLLINDLIRFRHWIWMSREIGGWTILINLKWILCHFCAYNVIDPKMPLAPLTLYRMVIMLALITIASCRIRAYYPHYEPLWVINCYLHVCCRPLGDTNNNIDSTSSIVYAPNQTDFGLLTLFIHYKETSICYVLFILLYYLTINAMPCHSLLHACTQYQ